MASQYHIAGVRFYRRSTIKLTVEERSIVHEHGTITLRRRVEWPLLNDAIPDFAGAYVDEGDTDTWGSGPYLKVPHPADDWRPVNRVFCPWGYPPDRIRVARKGFYLYLTNIALERIEENNDEGQIVYWDWLLTVATCPASSPT